MAATFGSFFNVVAWRVPRGMSVVHPGSHCPGCGTPIPWYRNIPVATWILQKGRCAKCGFAIPPRYVLVEGFCALLGFAWCLAWLAGLWSEPSSAVAWIAFALAGVPVALVDWDTFEIPDGLVVAAGVAGAGARVLLSEDRLGAVLPVLRDGLLAAGLLYAISFGSRVGMSWLGGGARRLLRSTRPNRRAPYRGPLRVLLRWSRFGGDVEALGLGDVSLGLAAGASLGFEAVLLGLPIAALLGLAGQVLATGVRTRARGAGLDALSIPFGPFLVAGFLLAAAMLASGAGAPLFP